MTEFNQAIGDIRSIRRQVAQATEFRGYGPATLLATAVVAVLGGVAQSRWVSEPVSHPAAYVGLWLGIGVFCAALIATQMLTRASRMHSGMADEMIVTAVAQFLPAAAVGAILPFVLLRVAPAAMWMMPGLWQLIFSLGVFASCRGLPRWMLLAGAWFFVTGFACLLCGAGHALAPIAMAGPYAAGMGLVSGIHYFSARRVQVDDDEES